MSIILLILLFHIPDSSNAGMMSDRFAIMFFMILIIWLSVQTYPKWLTYLSIGLILTVDFGLINNHCKNVYGLNNLVKQFMQIENKMENHSILLPLNYSDNWLAIHFSNYNGLSKDIVILENVDAAVGWYPVIWHPQKPQVLIGNHEMNLGCLPFRDEYHSKSKLHKIDYVAIFGTPSLNVKDSCQNATLKILSKDYNVIYKSNDNFVELYKIKNK